MNGSKELMNEKIQQLLDEVDKVNYLVITVQNELEQFAKTAHRENRMAHLKERVGEIRTRLEGVREFLCAAQELANRESDEEEIDLWM
jgi:molecular chaperone GrpE (heat shock protein)